MGRLMILYITFGTDHNHYIDGKTFDSESVAEIECTNYADGREKAFNAFGPKFAFSYDNLNDLNLHYYSKGLIAL